MKPIPQVTLAVALLFSADLESAAIQGRAPGGLRVEFKEELVNLESSVEELVTGPPASVIGKPTLEAGLWFGHVVRRLKGDGPRQDRNFVSFAVRYKEGAAVRVWFDANLNGDLTDDAAPSMSAYPEPEGARSFLTDLNWSVDKGVQPPAARKIRVVLEPQVNQKMPPLYRVQLVHGLLGRMAVDGTIHRVLLLDGNGDGIYNREFADGLVVDTNDDSHFEIDQMSPEFAPLSVPFQIGRSSFEAQEIDPAGRYVNLRFLRHLEAVSPAVVGKPAPGFSFQDLKGTTHTLDQYRGRVVLIYFWASSCGPSEWQSPILRTLMTKYPAMELQILGVSFDTDASAMRTFMKTHSHAWPTRYTGRLAWEDPIGKAYEIRAPGSVYVVDVGGKLDSIQNDPAALSARVADLVSGRHIDTAHDSALSSAAQGSHP